ncbi:MAG: hypothetical protein JO235_23625 [Chroococcidiopsidaceae cyanobacterium CP_BM_RX_35]|nr:hypothetical protein [Chroococcidiopsidaceae cyanobacterium CP_BM_RX_35]
MALICDEEILASRLRNRPTRRGFTDERIKEHLSYNRWLVNNAHKTKLLNSEAITFADCRSEYE